MSCILICSSQKEENALDVTRTFGKDQGTRTAVRGVATCQEERGGGRWVERLCRHTQLPRASMCRASMRSVRPF